VIGASGGEEKDNGDEEKGYARHTRLLAKVQKNKVVVPVRYYVRLMAGLIETGGRIGRVDWGSGL